MPLPDGERLARLEAIALELRAGLHERVGEEKRTRERLHALEKVTEGLLTLQRELHRQNDARLRRMALSIQWAGFGITVGMFALGILTFLSHH